MAEITGSIDTRGAGMHIGVVFGEDALYPDNHSPYEKRILTEAKLRNFTRSMQQLLPSLYLLATPNEDTRQLGFREPRISVSGVNWASRDKYSAIHISNGCIEYRVFDTCYDDLNVLADDIVVIGNSIQYLTSRYRSPKLEAIMGNGYGFGNDSDTRTDRLFQDTKVVDLLDAGLDILKPSYLSKAEIVDKRKVALDREELAERDKKHAEEAAILYEEYSDRFDRICKERVAEFQATAIRRRLENGVSLSTTRAEIAAMVKSDVERYARDVRGCKRLKQDYITDSINKLKDRGRTHYTISPITT